MKYSLLVILILGFCSRVQAQELQDLDTFFKPQKAFLNPITAKTYFLEDSIKCSSTLILNSDSTFLREIGCEGNSFVTVGHWRQFKDSVELIALKQQDIRLFNAVKIIDNQIDTTTTFHFTDKLGKPVKASYLIVRSFFRLDRVHNGRGNRTIRTFLKTNKKGKIDVKKWDKWGRWEMLDFYKFEEIVNKKFRLDFRNLPSKVYIQLNINRLALLYSNITYYYFDKPKTFKYTDTALTTDFNVWKRILVD